MVCDGLYDHFIKSPERVVREHDEVQNKKKSYVFTRFLTIYVHNIIAKVGPACVGFVDSDIVCLGPIHVHDVQLSWAPSTYASIQCAPFGGGAIVLSILGHPRRSPAWAGR